MRDESGQVLVFVAVILTGLVGMAALVVDVGSWYHARPKAADRCRCGRARRRPAAPAQQSVTARTKALDYAQLNYAGIPRRPSRFPMRARSTSSPREHARDLRSGAQRAPSTS